MIDGKPDAARPASPLGAEDIFGIGRPIGEVLRDFHLLSKLGEGGMGVVYKAHQLSLDQDVALKILAPQLAERHDFVSRFYREARMSVQLKGNANIVHGVAVGFACALCGYNGMPEEHPTHPAGADRERGVHYFAMEFVEGQNLAQWLIQLERLPVGDAVKIAIDVARALDYAHSRKRPIFHRDVKPANIMVTPDGEVKLADLGLAKAAEEDGPTQIGEMAGTPAYMPPEQARNAAMIDGRSDIYALGATLYVLLTGKKPFPGKTTLEILEAKERGRFEPAHGVNAEVPGALDRILTQMLAADVSRRYQTAQQVVAALTETGLATRSLTFLDHDATLAGPPGTDTRWVSAPKRRWVIRTLEGTLALVLITALYYFFVGAGSHHFFQLPHTLASGEQQVRAASNGEPVDMVLARAMEQVAGDEANGARGTLKRWLTEHPGDERIERPLQELERGSLVLFQHQTPDATSPIGPIWTADGISLTERDNYRFGVALAHECYLYAYQCDTRPSATLIFPNPHYSPLSNPVSAGSLLWLPADSTHGRASWLHLDSSPGEERVYFIAVTAPLRDLVGLGNQLAGNPMNRAFSALLQSYALDGKPPVPCFAADTAIQVFRFEHAGKTAITPGRFSIGRRGNALLEPARA